MRNSFLTVLLSLAFLQASAQLPFDQSEQIVEDIRYGIEYLSSEACFGRGTADVGMEKAKDFIVSQLRESRILPAFERNMTGNFLQEVPFIQSEIYGGELRFGNTSLTHRDDFYYFRNVENRPFTSDAISFVGYGVHSEKYSEYGDLDLHGQAVILLGSDLPKKLTKAFPKKERKKRSALNSRLALLKKKNPAFIVVIDPKYDENFDRFSHYLEQPSIKLDPMLDGSQNDEYRKSTEDKAPSAPVAYLSSIKGYQIIHELFDIKVKKGDLLKNISIKQKLASVPSRFAPKIAEAEVKCHNIGAYIPGENDDKVIVLSAHLDHLGIDHENGEIYFGADDNASGSATLLAIAKMMNEEIVNGNPIPQNPVMFLWFTGEEKGLLGSKYYVKNPAFALDNMLVNLNVDMVGRNDKHHSTNEKYIHLIGANRNSDKLTGLIEEAAKGSNIELDFRFNDPEDPNQFYKRSDHYNFAKYGVPVAFFFSGVHEDYHKSSDTFEKINFDVLKNRAELIYHSAALLSTYEEQLRREGDILKREEMRQAEELRQRQESLQEPKKNLEKVDLIKNKAKKAQEEELRRQKELRKAELLKKAKEQNSNEKSKQG